MKHFFSQDKIVVGLVAGLGSELFFCLLLATGLLLAGEGIADHIRWFGGMFIPLLLILRTYAKSRQHLTVTKTLIITFFATFVAFIFYLLRSRTLNIEPFNF